MINLMKEEFDPPKNRDEAEQLIQMKIAAVNDLLRSAMDLANEHCVVIKDVVFDSSLAFFPKDWTNEKAPFYRWTGIDDDLVQRYTRNNGEWLNSSEYGNCD